LAVVFILILFIALYVGIDANLERFALDNLLHEDRPVVWANTLSIFSNHPLFGTGLGTFASIYPAYEDSKEFARYSHAHNDYLEYLAELGIFGFVFLVGFNLHIPANMVLFSVVLSLSMTVAFYKRKEGNNTVGRMNNKGRG